MAANQLTDFLRRLSTAMYAHEAAGVPDARLLESFISRKDEAAFEALLRRHGPMVWGVCRRVLGHAQDAEDAFQATFLVLVRKAAAILPRAMVGHWLYGVAYRTALKARAAAGKRRSTERQVEVLPEPKAAPPEAWPDLRALLDQAVDGLPAKYRAAVVLCDLEGKTYQEAARQLDWPVGTVSTRLVRARKMLARRLARHGLVLSAGAVATVWSQNAASAGMPPALLVSTVHAAGVCSAGAAAPGALSAQVVALTEGVLKAMFQSKLKTVTIVALLVAALGLGFGSLCSGISTATPPPKKLPQTPAGTDGAKPKADKPGPKGPDPKAVKKEMARLQGTWVMAAVQWAGEGPAEQDVTSDARRLLLITGNKCVEGQVSGKKGEWFLRIDPTTKPKHLDMGKSAKFKAGETTYGIYELKGDNLKILWGGKRPKERPKAMKATAVHNKVGGELIVYWQRVKK
jgi:RNA polymerase sigma-70 factor (ECF subfamily)